MIIVADSSPLISFAILKKLDLLDMIFDEILIPKAVSDEISVEHKPHSQELTVFTENKIRAVQNRLAVQFLKKDLDIGEAEAIVLAIENKVNHILIDEYKGRKISKNQGLSPIGTIGVLLEAKRKNLIQEVKPDLDSLIANHRRISQPLYKKALELAKEK